MSNQIAVVSPTSIISDDMVAQLATRIITLLPRVLPSAQGLTEDEALALSQVALLHNLSPFNGEIWYLKGNGRSLGVMPGIKGYRKHARRALRNVDPKATYSIEYRVAQPNEAEAVDGSLVVEAILRVSLDIDSYLRSRELAMKSTLPGASAADIYADLSLLIGPPPVYRGFGVIRPDEFKRLNDAHLNRLAQAHVRAERTVLRQRFDLEIGNAAYRDAAFDEIDADMLDASVVQLEDETLDLNTAAQAARHERSQAEMDKMDKALGLK